jgi:hypothetical protein
MNRGANGVKSRIISVGKVRNEITFLSELVMRANLTPLAPKWLP